MDKKGTFNKIRSFFREVGEETRKVSWPNKKEAYKYTIIVIGTSVAVAFLLGVFDYAIIGLLRKFVF
ncbi:MAG: preprotein translocase subunit SecE [Candidatus Pacebacteria bacterium]|nr:preprotein translocase subunit SecE [Candidatus Paceibacterota bacterium]